MSEGRSIYAGSARNAATRISAAVVLALASLPAVVHGFVVPTSSTRGGAIIRSSHVWEAGRKPQLARSNEARTTRPSGKHALSDVCMGDIKSSMAINVRRGTMARGVGAGAGVPLGSSFPSLRAAVSASIPGLTLTSAVGTVTSQAAAPSAMPCLVDTPGMAGGIDALLKSRQVSLF
jgi:hypothetical protein